MLNGGLSSSFWKIYIESPASLNFGIRFLFLVKFASTITKSVVLNAFKV